MDIDMDRFAKIAEVLKALSHPVRLCIVHGLIEKGSCNVSYMEKCLDMSQSGISQHLSKLKSAGIVKNERSGNEVYYKIANDDVKKLIVSIFDNCVLK